MFLKLYHSKVIRYILSAGVATVVDVSAYFLTYNYILHKQDTDFFNFFKITAPTVSLAVSYSFGLLTNFTITKLFVFHESDLRTRHQLIRYVSVALVVLAMHYALMTYLIRHYDWYPTIARATAAVCVGAISFTIHKYFSFRVSQNGKEVSMLDEE